MNDLHRRVTENYIDFLFACSNERFRPLNDFPQGDQMHFVDLLGDPTIDIDALERTYGITLPFLEEVDDAAQDALYVSLIEFGEPDVCLNFTTLRRALTSQERTIHRN